jgi:hypothetical protein
MATTARKNTSGTNLLLVGLSTAFLAVAIVIITAIPCPSEPQFQFYKIILALSVAGVASILPGFMRIRYKGYVSAGGAMAVFVFVLTFNPGFITNSPKCKDVFNLNIQFYGDSAKGIILNAGTVKVVYKGTTKVVPLQQDGKITLEELPMDVLDKPILITPQIEDYSKAQKQIVLSDPAGSLDLVLEPVKPVTRVRGSVYFNGNPLQNGIVNIDGHISKTDEYGNFAQDLELKTGTPVNIKVLSSGKLIFNSTELVSDQFKQIFIK